MIISTPGGLLGLALVSLVVSLLSVNKAKQGKFYQDVPYLWPLGIYIWGDGLILGPFWLGLAALFLLMQMPVFLIFKAVLLFWVIRSGYEVIYWLVHQASAKKYEPPLFRNVSWLGSQEAAILYQLLHTCILVVGLGLLLWF